jgi:hypothetical protein
MKEPVRLERSGRPLVRALVRVGRGETPSARVFERTLGALGVAAPTATMLGLSLAARAATVASSNASSTVAASAGVGLVAKWVGAGVVAGVVVSGSAVGLDRLRAPESAPRALSAPAVARPAPSAELARAPVPAVALAPSTHEVAPASAPVRSGESEIDSQLTREVGLVDRARAALSRGDSGAALEALDRYEREVTGGRLGAEAMYLRMEALSRQGEHAQAANAARRLLSAYPDGPHAARAKALVGITAR